MNIDTSRILIVKPSSLGDIVHSLPIVHALKRCFPGGHIGWIVQDVFAELIERDGSVDSVYPIHISSTSDPQTGRFSYMRACKETVTSLQLLRRILKRRPYDFVLDLHASFRSGLLGRTNSGGIRVGFKDARELNTFFQHQLVAVPEHVEHALAKNLLFCDHLNCNVADEDFHMCCSEEDVNEVQLFLYQHDITDDVKVICANPAARWQTKFWTVEQWADLADRYYAQGIKMIFGGSRQDTTYIESITRLMKTPPIVAAGRFSLPQYVALLKRACLYVGPDSGPMHMAALSSIPVVALFGPTHPARVGPYGVEHRIVRAKNLDCLECRKRSCDHLSCMKGISVEMVFDAAISLMSRQSSQSGKAV